MNMQTRLKQKHSMEKKIPPKDSLPNNQLGNMKTQKGQQIQIQKNSPIITSLHYTHKNSPNFLTKSRKIGKKKKKKTTLLLIKSQKRSRTSFKSYKKPRKPKPFIPSPFKARNPMLKHKRQRKRSKIQDEINNNNKAKKT